MPIYNALDPETHFPVPPETRFAADLGFLGNRLPDREARVEEFFLAAAAACRARSFLLGGNGWEGQADAGQRPLRSGMSIPRDHNAFNCSPRAVLNISRESMARYGFSPATRVFEAAGAAACLITDAWEGIEQFFEPGEELLVAHDGAEVAELRAPASPPSAPREIGAGRAFAARWPSTPTRTAPSQWKHALEGSRAAAHEDRHPRSFDHLLMGQWPRDHLSRPAAGAQRARPRCPLSRARPPWYAREPRPAAPAVLPLANSIESVTELQTRFAAEIREADCVIVGSYVPEGIEVGEWVIAHAGGVTAFYDIDTPVTLAKLARGRLRVSRRRS